MAKGGTLTSGAKTTKKSLSSSSLKSGKSAVIGESKSKPAASSTSKKSKSAGASLSGSKAGSAASLDAAPAAPLSDDIVLVDANGKERRPLNVKDPRYTKHYKAILKESLEGGEMLHCENQNNVETILKLFDLNPEYGPAVGMSRLDRWKRASRWGLDPPEEVLDILTTIQGEKEAKYRESLFDGMV